MNALTESAKNLDKLLSSSKKSASRQVLHRSANEPSSQARPAAWSPMSLSAMVMACIVAALASLGISLLILHPLAAGKIDLNHTPSAEVAGSSFAGTAHNVGRVEDNPENISVGSPQAGIVTAIVCRVGDTVAPGDELFRLDDRHLQAELAIKSAALKSAQAELARLEAGPRTQQQQIDQAAVEEAESQAAEAKDVWERIKQLVDRHVVAEMDFLSKQRRYEAALARLKRAKAQLELTTAGTSAHDKQVAQAAIEHAQAHVQSVKTDIERLSVRSLISGKVLKVDVRPGEFVGAPAAKPLIVLSPDRSAIGS